MTYDAQGLLLSTDAGESAGHAYRFAVDGFIQYRADLGARLAKLVEVDGGCAMANVLVGYCALMPLDASQVGTARQALVRAQAHARHVTLREQAHIAGLGFWINGELDQALSTWEGILADHPRDLLALRLHHNTAFWYGLPTRMLREIENALPHWSNQLAGYGTVLACASFANEECRRYPAAEKAGWMAMETDPGNLWATHALTHIMEMQGRRDEGIQFLRGLETHWGHANNFKHHLWWHRALFHLESQAFDEVLDLYDDHFRDLASPLLQNVPDLYNDILNATSMLFRLKLHGVPTGTRWEELANLAELRTGDTLATLTLPHWMMALTGAGRWLAAERFLQAVIDALPSQSTGRQVILKDVAVPICRAVLLHAREDYAGSVAAILPALNGLHRLGGSHAQRDVFGQLFIDAALRSGLDNVTRQHLDQMTASDAVAPLHRIGYAKAARHIGHGRVNRP